MLQLPNMPVTFFLPTKKRLTENVKNRQKNLKCNNDEKAITLYIIRN